MIIFGSLYPLRTFLPTLPTIEHMSPETAVKFLNEYFSAMHDVIEEHDGQIINYIGDSVMVVYGAPQKLEDHEIISVRCAIAMREKLKELNQNGMKLNFLGTGKTTVLTKLQQELEFILEVLLREI